MALGQKTDLQKESVEKRFEETTLKKKVLDIENDDNKNDAVIQVLLPEREKNIFSHHCKRIGTSTSNKLREILYKYMETNGLR
jgi:hypothetical protein